VLGRFISFAAFLLFGALVGAIWRDWAGAFWGLTLFAFVWWALDAWRGQRFLYWLQKSGKEPVPYTWGLWGEVTDRAWRMRRDSDRKLVLSEQRLNDFLAAIQASPNGVLLLDQEGKIEWANQTVAQHLGIDVVRDHMQVLTNLLRGPEFLKYQAQADFSQDVVIAGRDDKPQRPVRIAVRLHPYGDGRKLMLTRDITALEQAEAMRRDFVANVSHEIRTPLTVIAGFVETMQSLTLEPEETQRYLNLMAGHSQRMKNLVEDLLILSRLEGSPLPGVDQSVGLKLVWDQAHQEARALSSVLMPVSAQQFDFNFPTELNDAALIGVPTEIQSAWSNLLSNAVRYTPAGGRVEARAHIDVSGLFCLSVQDSGPGIAPEHLSRLTERFYRVDSSRSRDLGGTGLGLSIVKHVMQRHGGELRIDSQLGVGSRFELAFPAARMRGLSPLVHAG